MIWLAIMLFMIGQALNMGTAYWIIWGLFIFFKLCFIIRDIIHKEPDYLEKRVADKMDKVIDKLVNKELEKEE